MLFAQHCGMRRCRYHQIIFFDRYFCQIRKHWHRRDYDYLLLGQVTYDSVMQGYRQCLLVILTDFQGAIAKLLFPAQLFLHFACFFWAFFSYLRNFGRTIDLPKIGKRNSALLCIAIKLITITATDSEVLEYPEN